MTKLIEIFVVQLGGELLVGEGLDFIVKGHAGSVAKNAASGKTRRAA